MILKFSGQAMILRDVWMNGVQANQFQFFK